MTTKLSDFPEIYLEHFKVIVTCTLTLTLPWQPSFESQFFRNYLLT